MAVGSNGLEKGSRPRSRACCEHRRVPLPRGVRLGVEVVQRATAPQVVARADAELRTRGVDGDRVGGVGLELHGLRAALGDRVDDLEGAVQGTVVVAGDLGDDEGGVVGTDPVAGQVDRGHGALGHGRLCRTGTAGSGQRRPARGRARDHGIRSPLSGRARPRYSRGVCDGRDGWGYRGSERRPARCRSPTPCAGVPHDGAARHLAGPVRAARADPRPRRRRSRSSPPSPWSSSARRPRPRRARRRSGPPRSRSRRGRRPWPTSVDSCPRRRGRVPSPHPSGSSAGWRSPAPPGRPARCRRVTASSCGPGTGGRGSPGRRWRSTRTTARMPAPRKLPSARPGTLPSRRRGRGGAGPRRHGSCRGTRRRGDLRRPRHLGGRRRGGHALARQCRCGSRSGRPSTPVPTGVPTRRCARARPTTARPRSASSTTPSGPTPTARARYPASCAASTLPRQRSGLERRRVPVPRRPVRARSGRGVPAGWTRPSSGPRPVASTPARSGRRSSETSPRPPCPRRCRPRSRSCSPGSSPSTASRRRARVDVSDVSFNRISGHRDANATACPGARLYANLPALRTAVAALLGSQAPSVLRRSVDAGGTPDLLAWAPGDRGGPRRVSSACCGRRSPQPVRSGVRIGAGWNSLRHIVLSPDLTGDGQADIVAVSPASTSAAHLRGQRPRRLRRRHRTGEWLAGDDPARGVGRPHR